MDFTKLPPGVLLAGLAAVLVAGFLLSRGSAGSVITQGGTDSQTNFKNAMALQDADTARKGLLTTALLAYDKQSKDYTLGQSTLAAKTGTERYQLETAYKLGLRAIDSNQTISLRNADVQETLGTKQIDATERTAARQDETQRQNGILNFFGNLFGGVLKLFGGL